MSTYTSDEAVVPVSDSGTGGVSCVNVASSPIEEDVRITFDGPGDNRFWVTPEAAEQLAASLTRQAALARRFRDRPQT